MKANEFIKEYGLGEAVELVNSVKFVVKIKDIVCDPCFLIGDYALSYKELKHLTESHELIESCGGLQSVGEKLTHGMYESRAVIERLKQAITDVESCQ